MKSISLTILFAFGILVAVQAQETLRIIVNNHTSDSWVYKLSDNTHSLVNQSFQAGTSTEFLVDANAYQFPFHWGAGDAGGCYEGGMHPEPAGPLNTPFACTNAVMTQAFAMDSNGGVYLFVDME